MHGQFVWYELTTSDAEGAKKFYPRFTGWGTQQFDKDYTMWTTGGVPFAGIFTLTPEMRARGVPPNWMPYVEVTNVDDAEGLSRSLGGTTLHGPADIPGTGRFAVLQDPQGAAFAIYSSTGPSSGWDGTPVVGRFSWHELMTTDCEKAFAFYARLFGWEKTGEMDMGGGNKYLMAGKGKKMYAGMFNQTVERMPPFWLCYIHVKDVAKAIAAVTRAGGRLHRGPMPVPGGAVAILADPQGAAFAVHHANPPAAAAPQPAAKKPAKAATKVKAKAKVTAKSKAKPIAKAKPKAETKPKAKPKTKPKPKAKAKPRAKAKPKAKAKAKARPKRKSNPNERARTRVRVVARRLKAKRSRPKGKGKASRRR